LEWWLIDLKKEKTKKEKTRAKSRGKVNCIDSIVVFHQLAMTFVYIGSKM
jgi:hypothetical protein